MEGDSIILCGLLWRTVWPRRCGEPAPNSPCRRGSFDTRSGTHWRGRPGDAGTHILARVYIAHRHRKRHLKCGRGYTMLSHTPTCREYSPHQARGTVVSSLAFHAPAHKTELVHFYVFTSNFQLKNRIPFLHFNATLYFVLSLYRDIWKIIFFRPFLESFVFVFTL